jgi:hypothetical protein
VDDGGSGFFVLLLGDPEGLESGEGRENRSSDPDQELSFLRGNDLDLHGGGGQSGDFLAESFWDAGEHGGSSGHDDVAIKIFSDVNIAFKDGPVDQFVESSHFLSDHGGLEEGFWASESLVSDGDGLSVREFVGLVVLVGLGVALHFGFVVQGHVGEVFLDVSDGFGFGGGSEVDSDFVEEFSQMLSQISASQVVSLDGVWKGITFVDGYCVGHTISSVQNQPGGSSRRVKGEDGLDGQVESGYSEGVEHDFCHFLSILLGVSGG